jgi:hypothetical protein
MVREPTAPGTGPPGVSVAASLIVATFFIGVGPGLASWRIGE